MGFCFSSSKAKEPLYSSGSNFDVKNRSHSENKILDLHSPNPKNENGQEAFSNSSSFQLENASRRRLTVSTVSCDADNVLAMSKSLQKSGSINSPNYSLIDEATGQVKNVSSEMIYHLVSQKASSLIISGVLSVNQQHGFDKKEKCILGTRAKKKLKLPYIGYACHKGLKPESPNQDDFILIQVDDWSLYGVFDGHGPYGHHISSYVRNALPYLLLSKKMFFINPLQIMQESFRHIHSLLQTISDDPKNSIDCSLSGTTATIIFHKDQELYIAHVGDSRGVIAEKASESKHFRAINLTADHKPTREDERKRIEAVGGEIKLLEGDVPYRVFAKNRLYPGLAMSRALGDTVGSAVGVIPDPEVQVYKITKNTKFMILATDGIWEFISSQEAVDFVVQQTEMKAQRAADYLAYESWSRWISEEENVVDDLTCIVVWFLK